MGLLSKIGDKLHSDKHKDEDPADTPAGTSSAPTSSQTKSYYTGPKDTSEAATGHAAPPTGSHGLNPNTTSSSHGQFADTTAGPHSSNTANKLDPKTDSDLDRTKGYSDNHSAGLGGGSSAGYYGSSNTTSGVGSTNPSSSHGQYGDVRTGPHSSGMANKADPRVDSDNDRYTSGGISSSNPAGSHGRFTDTTSPSVPGAFPGESSGLGHSSRPHVDKDGYGSVSAPGVPNYTGSSSGPNYGPGSAGQNFSGRDPYPSTNPRDAPGPYGSREDYGPTGPASNTLGPHSSNAANVADPRVRPEPEKMRDHKTVGPHQSDMMNKLDPRVDSDPRHAGYPRDPNYSERDRYDDRSGYDSHHRPSQTGGLIGGDHKRMENPAAVPTAGGSHVGTGNGPYDTSSHGGITGGRDPYDSRSGPHASNMANRADPMVDSDNDRYTRGPLPDSKDPYTGVAGSHGRDPYDNPRSGHLPGTHSNDVYDSSRSGVTGGRDPYDTRSGPHASNMANRADPMVDSDNDRYTRGPLPDSKDPYGSSRGGGLTGSHGRDPYDSRTNEPYGHSSSGPAGSHTSGGLSTGMQNLDLKERELAIRQKELDLREREFEMPRR